jgi:excisionase family DNA binding protein
MTPRATCTITQAGALTHVSRRTIYNWLEQHKVEAIRTPSGRVRIYLDTLSRPFHPKGTEGPPHSGPPA